MSDEIKSYNLPDTLGLTPAEAGIELNKIIADSRGDSNHPWLDPSGTHPQHQNFQDCVTKLHKIKSEASDQREPLEIAMSAGLEHQVSKQNNLIAEAEAEADKLVELGFERSEVPDDIQPYQVNAWKMQRMSAERDYESLMPLLDRQLNELKTPAALMEAFQLFSQAADVDLDLREKIADDLIEFVYKANKIKHEGVE